MPDHGIPARASEAARWLSSRPFQRAYRRWRLRGLMWCHGCGAMVERLGNDDLCAQCEEIDARLALHIGAAAHDLAEQMIGVALDYLHPDDVLAVLHELCDEREPAAEPLATLRVRSHIMVANRVSRTSGGIRRHGTRANPRLDRKPRRTACRHGDADGQHK